MDTSPETIDSIPGEGLLNEQHPYRKSLHSNNALSGGEGRAGADGVSCRSRDGRIHDNDERDGLACDLS